MNDFALDDGELNGQSEVWLDTESTAQAVLALSGGVNKARFVESTTKVQFSSSIKPAIRVGLKSASGVLINAESHEDVRLAAMLESKVQHWLHSIGELRLDSYSSTGVATVELKGSGSIRAGAKIKLDGTASVFIELYSRGALGGIRYRYLSGESAINILSSWSPTGHPEQPDFYIPAQDERVLFATRDDRTLEVPMEVA